MRLLITGGTGSLGTAILRRLSNEYEIAVMARNESKMNRTLSEFPHVRGIIGDVRDKDKLCSIFPAYDYVIHAAAIKIVPVAEADPEEAVKTNVIGSLNVAQAAVEAKVKRVVGISTDKACGPTYYGLTKRLMEGIFRQYASLGETEFVLCRYGNVLKSANSVVPLFERQIKEDVPFTITDLRMTRFWLSMKDAVDLVLYTLNKGKSGDIIVPKAGAMKLVDLAKTLDPKREVKEIGIRPGERLHETLLVREESAHAYEKGTHFVIKPPQCKLEVHLPFQYEYTSDNPAFVISPRRLEEMLEDS